MRRSVALALALFLVYNLFLVVVRPTWQRSLEQNQDNRIKAQRYLYGETSPRVVLVGSSLTAALDWSHTDFTNLSMAGMGPLDGIEVVLRSKVTPVWIFIETNYFFRPENKDFQRDLFSPGFREARRWFPALRQEYQPANLLVPILDWLYRGSHLQSFALVPAAYAEGAETVKPVAKYINQSSLDELKSKLLSGRSTLPYLGQQVEALLRRGIHVGFYEIPQDSVFTDSPNTVKLRQEIQGRFPEPPFVHIELPRDRLYETRDGSHLIPESATAYASYLFSHINETLTKGRL